ncbi:DUF7543 family protein [Natronomonas sp. EA1]|uniref:DUF7543 family protein n=1 Tax=Natronomonas sp. EA1 TaxID=3421655 RepID=UPI003EBB284B
MPWTATVEEATRLEWERSDRYATIVARETTSGEWAVHVDRLIQAPEGDAYDHERVDDRDAALSLAATWREQYDLDVPEAR